MHYLITGGGGFIGTHLTLRLLEQGDEVSVLDNFSASENRLRGTKARIIKGSVLDRELVFSAASECHRIIHLAAVVGVRLAMSRGRETLKVSYLGSENVLEAASKLEKEIFIASSSAIYGKILHTPVSEGEDSLLGPTYKGSWLYSVGKLIEEHLALAYFRELGTRVKIGRFFNVIGPYQVERYGMVVPTFVSRALRGEPLLMYGSGRQTRTFVYVEDALDGLEILLEKGAPGEIYNIGGTEEISIRELAEKIKALTGSSSAIKIIPYTEAFDEQFEETQRRAPDITRLQKLGYRPRYTLEETLKKIIAHHMR
ncbi:MAG: NAD-dependent epimerase/dehydratase family protein [Dethiobacteria bacterium]